MVRSSALRSWWTALAVLALVALPALAQVQTGDVHGTVKDDKGQPLPGVTLTLKGATTAPQVQTSDASGQFRFVQLYPGTFSLKADLEGFSSVEMTAIEVRLGGNTNLEVTMSSAIREQITVTGEAPLLDERKTTQGANVGVTDLNRVPTARDPWSLLSQAPGVQVDRINVGGNESGQQSNFIGLGSTARDNVFAVDGVIVTDMNSVGASASYFDFGAFEEVQFTTSGADVSVATSGVTINQITKRGTNDWRANARYLDTDGQYQAQPATVGGQGYNKIDSVKEQGVDVGGPLWRDHLWVWGSYGENDIRNLVPTTLADGSPGYQLDRTKLHDANFKMNFQLGAQDSGVLHFWNNDKLKFGRGAGPDRAPATTWNQTTPAKFYKLEDTFIPSADFVLTVLGSHNPGKFTLTPQGGLDPYMFVDANGVLQGTYLDFKQDAKIDQYRGDASYFFNTGKVSHEMKFGGGYREQTNNSGTVWPHGILVTDPAAEAIDGTTALAEFPRNRQVSFQTQYTTAWVQDTISMERWTINAGLRYDGQRAKNRASFSPASPFNDQIGGLIPAINFSGNNAGGFTWNTVSPRLGVTYALGDQRKTLLRGSYSRYAEQLGQDYAGRVNPLGYSYAYFYFQDLNHNDRLDPSEYPSLSYAYVYNLNTANPASTIPANANSRGLKPTLTDEITLGVDQGVGANVVLSALIVLRDIHDIPEDRVLVVDETGQTRVTNRSDWVPSTITCPDPVNNPDCTLLPGGKGYSVNVYDLRDGLTPTGGTLRVNGDRKQIYKGITLGVNRRLANRWSGRANFTWADWKWDIGPSFREHADPTNLLIPTDGNDVYYEQSTGSGNKGNVFLGSRWSFNMYGMYQIAPDRPWGFDIAASLSGREGYVSPPYLKLGGPAGSRLVQLGPIDEFRNPNVYTLDARIEKEFKIRDLGITVGFDGFNLLDRHYVLQRALRQDRANSNQVFETLSPRVLRWGVTLRWK